LCLAAIFAPDTPTASKTSGNQQQLDAAIAEITVPISATFSPRLAAEPLGAAAASPV
jgi:hypothetical protein